jgi:flavin-dependent dehydrogenase
MTVHDVTIIGGGPAGASAAIRLAQSGRRVILFEKGYFPRRKLCGGFLSSDGLSELEDLEVLRDIRRLGAHPLRRSVIVSARGTQISCELSAEALSVSRDVMDELLLRRAQQVGVDVRFGEDGFQSASTSPYKVIASGRQGRDPKRKSALQRSPWHASPSETYVGIQALFKDIGGITDQVELDLVPSGYVGLARQEKDQVNLCALTTATVLKRWGPSLDDVLRHFLDENPVLRSHLAGATRVGSWMAVAPVRLGVRQLAVGTTFYIGDAACVVDPFVGEGMSIGLYASRLLRRAFEQTKYTPAQAYASYWRQAFMPALRWNALMRFAYAVPLFQEPMAHLLKAYPQGLSWLTDLTRHRLVETFE